MNRFHAMWQAICNYCSDVKDAYREFQKPKWVSEEEYFADDVERLDQESPGWDDPLRVQDAIYRLTSGMKREAVVCIYGEETVASAEKALEGPQ